MKRPGYLKEFLEYWTPRARDPQGMVQPVHSASGRPVAGMLQPHERRQAHYRDARITEGISQAGHAEAMIRQFATPPSSPKDCVFAAHHPNTVGGPENQDRPLPIRRKSGLWFVRMRGLHGLAAVAAHKLGGHHPSWTIFKASVRIGQARSKWAAQMPPVEKGLRVLP